MRKALQQAKKRGELKQQYNKGISTTTISNTKTTTEQQTRQAIKRLLTPMVKDQDLLNILSETQNFEKLKNRTEYTTQAIGTNNETLTKANLYNNTIEKALKDTNEILQIGDEIKKGYDKQTKRLKERGWQNAENQNNGTIHRTQLTITLQL